MRTPHLTFPAITAAAVLLLAACGTQKADGPAGGRAGGSMHGRSCASPPPAGAEAVKDGVRITALPVAGSACGPDRAAVAYEVTNDTRTPTTYTVTIGFLGATGGAVDNVTQTVEQVPPGGTVRRTVGRGETTGPEVTGAKIVKVRRVPSAEASTEGGPCPASGVRVYADRGDAAMGLRVVGLHLENCGSGIYRLNGYPLLQLLDEKHRAVDGVRVLHGGDSIASDTGADGTPAPLALKPGERAVSVMTWRNTTEFGDAVNAPYVRVRAKEGARPVTVIPELDLGTTGKLGVGPWKRDPGA